MIVSKEDTLSDSTQRKKKKNDPLYCRRRLGLYKKKIYKKSKQLIYVSLSGNIHTKESFKEIVELDNSLLKELNISKTGRNSSITDIKLLYEKVNQINWNEQKNLYDEKKLPYYFIPPSIIREYNDMGIYELYKEQIACLKIIFSNEEIENKQNERNEKNKRNDDSFFDKNVVDKNLVDKNLVNRKEEDDFFFGFSHSAPKERQPSEKLLSEIFLSEKSLSEKSLSEKSFCSENSNSDNEDFFGNHYYPQNTTPQICSYRNEFSPKDSFPLLGSPTDNVDFDNIKFDNIKSDDIKFDDIKFDDVYLDDTNFDNVDSKTDSELNSDINSELNSDINSEINSDVEESSKNSSICNSVDKDVEELNETDLDAFPFDEFAIHRKHERSGKNRSGKNRSGKNRRSGKHGKESERKRGQKEELWRYR